MGKQKPVKIRRKYNEAFKNSVCLEVLSGKLTHTEARRIYGIKGRSAVHKWIRDMKEQSAYRNLDDMKERGSNSAQKSSDGRTSRNTLERKKLELEEALKLAKLKITALETMIDVAESELKIDIRKKSGTKQ